MRTLPGALAICAVLGACTDTIVTQPPATGAATATNTAAVAATIPPAPRRPPAQQLDAADEASMARTTQTALEGNPPNEPLPWQGATGSGTVTPGAYYQTPDGQYCREFDETVTVGGETRRGHGRACREPDGTWHIVRN